MGCFFFFFFAVLLHTYIIKYSFFWPNIIADRLLCCVSLNNAHIFTLNVAVSNLRFHARKDIAEMEATVPVCCDTVTQMYSDMINQSKMQCDILFAVSRLVFH